jgi:chromosome segregation ATPase
MQKSQKDLGTKICENCITNYQKFEEAQLQLSEAQRKSDRLENQLDNFKANEKDCSDDTQAWRSKLNAEVAKNEALEGQISDYQMKVRNLEGRLQMQET